jgi:DNA-directed RNA polymerase specialized sigma24 family protein
VAVTTSEQAFTDFAREAQRRLNVALTAAYGPEAGHEATAEALAYAWRHWDRIRPMSNPHGYLYRVGQSKARRFRIWSRPKLCPSLTTAHALNPEPWIEPGLPAALEKLSRRQRTAVVLVHGFGWTQAETADLLGVSRTTVERHLDRGLAALRRELKVAA